MICLLPKQTSLATLKQERHGERRKNERTKKVSIASHAKFADLGKYTWQCFFFRIFDSWEENKKSKICLSRLFLGLRLCVLCVLKRRSTHLLTNLSSFFPFFPDGCTQSVQAKPEKRRRSLRWPFVCSCELEAEAEEESYYAARKWIVNS